MIHGYEEASIAPAIDLFDSGIIQQMVAAAREQYLQGQNDLDNFYKQYGDFLSPSAKDMDYYYNNTVGQINDLFNYAQANGIDLLRSAEGRALIANTRRNIPHAKLAEIRQSAKSLETYNKMVAQMKANGTYSADLEKYLGHNPANWDTVKNGVWSVESPTKYEDLNAATYKWFDALKNSDLGLDPSGMYRISGVNEQAMRNIVDSRLSDFTSSELGGYYYEKAKQDLLAENTGKYPTDAEIRQRLKDNIVTANMEKLSQDYNEDKYALEKVKFDYDMAKQKDDQAFRERMQYMNSLGKASSRGSGSGGSGSDGSSYGLSMLNRGVRNFSGSTNPGQKGLTMAYSIGKNAHYYRDKDGKLKARPFANKKQMMFDAYVMNDAENQKSFESRFKNREHDIKENGAVPYDSQYDRSRLFSDDSVMSYTYGYLGRQHATNRSFLDGEGVKTMKSTGRVYTAPMKDGTYSQYVEVRVTNGDTGESRRYWYRVTRTEPIKASYTRKNGKVMRTFHTNDGFNMTPSNQSLGAWTMTDADMNDEAGLSTKESGEEILLEGYNDDE